MKVLDCASTIQRMCVHANLGDDTYRIREHCEGYCIDAPELVPAGSMSSLSGTTGYRAFVTPSVREGQ